MIVFIVICCCIAVIIEAGLFMLVWNAVAPLFWSGAPILTFWQSLGVLVLLNFIGSFFRYKK